MMENGGRQLGLITLLTLLALPVSAATGKDITIGTLSEAQCADYNLDVYALPKHPADAAEQEACKLVFLHGGSSEQYDDKEALMLIDGRLIHLYRTDNNDNNNVSRKRYDYDFADQGRAVKVALKVRQTCPAGVEGCNYDGSLTVTTHRSTVAIRVTYYRGG